ncbi:S9 family peptidase [Pedobacter sp. Hv1]|uniref:alpha/beta hydrolase family protein n=1 Tax=Pedobacter sp. Hv1 TaxID=1740090 RepID=UPI0006D8C27D|nr:prolyl oligopeptidase family serine peptidase [Pedobacter sp. Hv1]KQC02046.1 hypothetical protein AQF98_00285 [Pedobacter sp. Hv1]
MTFIKVQQNLFFWLFQFVLLSILTVFTCPSFGQVIQKKELQSSEYNLWGEAHLDKISPDEEWASYKMTYENGNDTLFVRNIQNNKTYIFAGGDNASFTKNGSFICQIGEEIAILNLKTGKKETISMAKQFTYCEQTDQLIMLMPGNQKNNLIIRSLIGDSYKKIGDVTNFLVSPNGHQLVFSTFINNKSALSLINLKHLNDTKNLVIDSVDYFTGLTWNKDGRSFIFLSQATDKTITAISYYILGQDKLYQINPKSAPNFPINATIVYETFNRISISDDLQRVFFYFQTEVDNPKKKQISKVEIWNTNDKRTFKQQQREGNFQTQPKMALWLPLSNQISPITSNELPKVTLNGNLENAILSNPEEYEPQFKNDGGTRDFYVMNFKTFEKNILLKNQPYIRGTLNPSPSGKYFAYFKDNNWWVYNFSTKHHTNITANIEVKFTGKVRSLIPEFVYGNPGWSIADKEILLYDQYDVWAITPDGASCKRLTRGREAGISYRIANVPNKTGQSYTYDGPLIETFDMTKILFLRAKGEDGKTGYYKWSSNSGEKPIVYGDSYVDELNYSLKMGRIFFREQRFDLSPRLMSTSTSIKPIAFFKSNLQQEKYFWSKSELIEYNNSQGQKLKGVLIYPANYDPLKKYPMIVNIYEIQSNELHIYVKPTYRNEGGFNSNIFTSQGYFVFLPDISLEKGSPGLSAADCVISATKKIIEKGLVNPIKIGLIGHSFGGYETAFIITQTQLFATAIASGAITDLNSFYHTLGQRSGRPDMWRFEGEQWNMGGTPYEIPLAYQANSPIAHVQNIRTPVLLWSGQNDLQVDPHQSMEYYLALRRLGKKSTMLLYPNEGHVISNPITQQDITSRIEQWFDYYLKDEKPADWISKGSK